MQPHSFDYVRPQTLAKAIQVLRENGNRAKVLAGGQSLIPVLKLRLANPRVLVDINDLPGLAFIEERGGQLRIGALSRHRDFEQSKLIRGKYPIFSDVASVLGDPQVRNMGTIGGALAHADPASDWGTALLALEAELIARGPKGTRTIPIDRFFKDPFTTALRSAELLTEIRVPKSKSRDGDGASGEVIRMATKRKKASPKRKRIRTENGTHTITATVNGRTFTRAVEPRVLLVDFIRDELRLTGTHIGCDTSHCGACTILVDGHSVKSCTMLAVQADGRKITTIEGLSEHGRLHPIQEAFKAHHGLQCGFCTPGVVLAALELLQVENAPSEDRIRTAISGNICRCTGYSSIVDSVAAAGEMMRPGKGGVHGQDDEGVR